MFTFLSREEPPGSLAGRCVFRFVECFEKEGAGVFPAFIPLDFFQAPFLGVACLLFPVPREATCVLTFVFFGVDFLKRLLPDFLLENLGGL